MAMTSTSPQERLSRELWGADDVSKAPPQDEGWREHAILQRGEAFVVVPTAPWRVAAASLLRWTDAEPFAAKLGRLAGWTGMRTGLAQQALRRRMWIRTGGPDSLHHHLSSAIGPTSVHLSASFGPPRPNQKPVVRVFDDQGDTVGFAKIGWNRTTTELIRHEASFLGGLDGLRPQRLRIPELIASGRWRSRTVAVISPLLGELHFRQPEPPGPDVIQEVAALSDVYVAPLGASAYRRRLGTAENVAKALGAIDDRWADVRLPFGRWHGDWAPWNMSSSTSGLVVWDWERTAPDTPIGFDPLHYEMQRRLVNDDSRPLDSLIEALAACADPMQRLGVPARSLGVVATLYVAELSVRFADALGEPNSRVGWLDGLLGESIRHFASR